MSEKEIIDYFDLYIKITEKQIENEELFLVEDSEKEHLKAIKRLVGFIQREQRGM